MHFAKDCGGPDTLGLLAELKSGEILLLENTRFNKQEEKGDLEWAKSLSTLGEYYVNDAFGSAHREHCSTATIARFFDKEHKSFGLLMDAEVKMRVRSWTTLKDHLPQFLVEPKSQTKLI